MIISLILLVAHLTVVFNDPIIVNLKTIDSSGLLQHANAEQVSVKAGEFELGTEVWSVVIQKDKSSATTNLRVRFCEGTIDSLRPDSRCVTHDQLYGQMSLGNNRLEILSSSERKIILVNTHFHPFTKGAPKVGMLAPEFQATTITGENLALSDLIGKYVFLDFWGTWCSPCLEQMPYLEGASIKFEDNLVIIGVAQDEQANVQSYINTRPVHWAQIAEGIEGGNIHRLYGVEAHPTAYLINPEGVIISTNQRWLSGVEIMRTLNWILFDTL